MVKTFCENTEPIKVELIDREGNKIVKEGRRLTLKECKEIAIKYNETLVEKKEDSFLMLQKQMVYVFGGKVEEYEKYTIGLIKDVLAFIIKETTNPTVTTVQKKEE